jgi:hypothetical protein
MKRIPATKAERHAAIRERAAEAIRDLYHNATPQSFDDHGIGYEIAGDWFNAAAQFEIEYLQDGGAYGSESSYRKCLEADCNAGRYKSDAARRFYVKRGMRQMREERAKYAAWESIGEYGKLYQWGRGGRTLAPENIVRTRGGSNFSLREDYADDMTIADVVELIRVVEAFNRYVVAWNSRDNLQSMFDEANLADADESVALELATD